jgi:hypothetical protein
MTHVKRVLHHAAAPGVFADLPGFSVLHHQDPRTSRERVHLDVMRVAIEWQYQRKRRA